MNRHRIYNKNNRLAPELYAAIDLRQMLFNVRLRCNVFTIVVFALAMYYTPAHGASLSGGGTPGGAQTDLREPPTVPPTAPESPYKSQEQEQPLPPVGGVPKHVSAFQIEIEGKHVEQSIPRQEVQRFVDGIHQSHKGKFTPAQLADIAAQVARCYKRRGYVFTRVNLADKANNVVVLKIVEPTIGQVSVRNNRLYGDEQLLKPFRELQGKPLDINSIEKSLLLLNDYPGANVYGLFTKGTQLNTTNLVVKTSEEHRYDFEVLLDNYGTEYTRQYRARLRYAVNNLTLGGDRVFGDLLKTVYPNYGTFGAINYESPIHSLDYRAGLSYSRNQFDVGRELAAFGIYGATDIGRAYLRYTILRSRTENCYVWLDLSRKRSVVRTPGLTNRKDELTVMTAAYQYDSVDMLFGRIRSASNQAYINYSQQNRETELPG